MSRLACRKDGKSFKSSLSINNPCDPIERTLETSYCTTDLSIYGTVYIVFSLSTGLDRTNKLYKLFVKGYAMASNNLQQENVPISLNFKDIKFSIADRQILQGVSGKVKPGQILAIMGPSGSGKTTLLSILAGRLNADGGEVLINGKHMTKKLKKKIGFVLQDDIFFQHLTLKETLTYSAMLRLPDTLTKQQKQQKVEDIVDTLDIRKCLNTCIGSPMERGLSGGEKKRANIGCELITNPSILFLDEPTSGLDSSNALNLIKTLKDYAAKEKKTIVTSIHQPSSQIFRMFDKLMLLCEGQIAFYGKASRALDFFSSIGLVCETHFNPADYILEKITAGKEVEDFIIQSWNERVEKHQELKIKNENVSSSNSLEKKEQICANSTSLENVAKKGEQIEDDSSISQTSEKASETNLSEQSSKHFDADEKVLSQENLSFEGDDSENELLNNCRSPTANGDLRKSNSIDDVYALNPKVDELSSPTRGGLPLVRIHDDVHLDIHDDDDDDEDDYSDVSTAWATSFWTQFSVLTERTFKQSKPEILSKMNFFQTFAIALITGLIWFRIPYTEQTIRDRYAMIFFVVVYWNFNPMFGALVSFPSERIIINKERAAGYYRLSAYYFAKLVSEIPLVVCQPFAYLLVVYWMCGLNESVAFLGFVFVLLLTSLTAQSIGLFLSATIMEFKHCITVASIFGLTCMLLGGFYQQHIPPWLNWFKYISYLMYSFEACMIVEFETSKPFRCQEFSIYSSCQNNRTYIQGKDVLKQLGVTSTLWENILFLLGFAFIFRVGTYLSLKYLNKPK